MHTKISDLAGSCKPRDFAGGAKQRANSGVCLHELLWEASPYQSRITNKLNEANFHANFSTATRLGLLFFSSRSLHLLVHLLTLLLSPILLFFVSAETQSTPPGSEVSRLTVANKLYDPTESLRPCYLLAWVPCTCFMNYPNAMVSLIYGSPLRNTYFVFSITVVQWNTVCWSIPLLHLKRTVNSQHSEYLVT